MELDFLEIPLPNEMPNQHAQRRSDSIQNGSTAIENLLSQNEDLMARLKVNIRRLNAIEEDNQRLRKQNESLMSRQRNHDDQMMVYKEKDQMWKNKIDALEKEKDVAVEKMRVFDEIAKKQNAELERFQRYHERIQNQVKPYIEQLKEFSQTLEERNQDLDRKLIQKETTIRDLRNQILDLTKNSKTQVEFAEKRLIEATSAYETELSQLRELREFHQSILPELEAKANRLSKILERNSELENLTIELQRKLGEKDELQSAARAKDLAELTALKNELMMIKLEHQDLKHRALADEQEIKTQRQQSQQATEQMESLRYMWNAKNEECEKLRSALNALEKLNVDLSTEVNRRRVES